MLRALCLGLTALFGLATALAQPPNVTELQVRPLRPLYERELLNNNLAIDLAFRTLPGAQVTFQRGRLDYFDGQGNLMGGLEITPAVFLSNLRIFQPGGGTDPASLTINPGRVVLVMLPVLQFPRKQCPASLRARIFFAGFAGAAEFEEIRPRLFRQNAGRYVFPFVPSPFPQADWLTSQGHGLISFSHRRSAGFATNTIISLQRYADDYDIRDGSGRTLGNPALNESHYAFGQPAVAIADGVVMRTSDGIADNFPVGTVQTQGYGNNMHIDHENGEISHFVHLKNGSVRVQPGQRVSQGEVVAELGNSGSSSAPHVHFEVALSLDRDPGALSPIHTEGQPFYPANIRMLGARQIGTVLPTNLPFEVVDPPVIPESSVAEGPGTIAEAEPNGDLASAQALALPVKVEGTIRLGEAGGWADAGDVIEDIFRIDLDEPATLWLAVRSLAAADLDLLLFDDQQRIIAESSGASTEEELAAELQPGTYFIFLSEFGDSAAPGPESSYVLQAALLDQELLFAQYGQGEGLTSTLLLMDPSGQADQAAALVDLRQGDGSAFPPASLGTEVTSSLLAVPPRGLLLVPSASQGELITGSARILSSRPLAGTVLFGGPQGLEGVPADAPVREFLVPVQMDASNQVRTGIAIANPHEDELEIVMTLLNAQGLALAQASVSEILPPRGRTARFADEIFDASGLDLEDFQGVLRATVDQPVAATVIRNSPGEFAAFPVTPLTPAPSGPLSGGSLQPSSQSVEGADRGQSARLALADGGEDDTGGLVRRHSEGEGQQVDDAQTRFFPQFASGPGISTTLILLNPSPDQPVTAQLDLTDQDGNSLTALLTGMPQLEAEIPPLGVRFISLPPSANLFNGWAQLQSDGNIGAVLVLEGDVGAAGIAPASAAARFLAPIDLDLSSGVQTGIALANPSPSTPAQCTLQLRDADGQTIMDASTDLTLPPQAHLARQIEELFPSLTANAFTGVLETTCDLPLVAAAIRQSPSQFATLPVAPRTAR